MRATNFANGARKGVYGNYFHGMTLAELFTLHVNLQAMEFPLIFGETNFVEVPKSTKSANLRPLKKEHPTVFDAKKGGQVTNSKKILRLTKKYSYAAIIKL